MCMVAWVDIALVPAQLCSWAGDFPSLSLSFPSVKWSQPCICPIGSSHSQCLAQCLARSKSSLNAGCAANVRITTTVSGPSGAQSPHLYKGVNDATQRPNALPTYHPLALSCLVFLDTPEQSPERGRKGDK